MRIYGLKVSWFVKRCEQQKFYRQDKKIKKIMVAS